MKKLLLHSFLFLVSANLMAQASYNFIAVGYNFSYKKPTNLNYIIDRYNQTRPWLNQEMKEFKHMNGMYWAWQSCYSNIIIDVNFIRRVAVVSSQGDNGAGLMQRDLRLKASTINFGLGLNLTRSAPFFGMGLNFDFGVNSVGTRVAAPDAIKKIKFAEIVGPVIAGFSLWSQFLLTSDKSKGFGLLLRPYYHFDISSHEYYSVNVELNPNTYQNDPQTLSGRLSHFGFVVALVRKFSF